jgi:hypothetical protein
LDKIAFANRGRKSFDTDVATFLFLLFLVGVQEHVIQTNLVTFHWIVFCAYFTALQRFVERFHSFTSVAVGSNNSNLFLSHNNGN